MTHRRKALSDHSNAPDPTVAPARPAHFARPDDQRRAGHRDGREAHTGLSSSNPADGSTLTSPVPAVDLTFTGQVLLREVTVTGPAGTSAVAGAASASGAVVTQPVTLTGAGTYTVGYAVTSSDGHPLDGSVTFTYAPPSDAAAPTGGPTAVPSTPTTPPSAAAEASEAAADRPAPESAELPLWVPALAAVFVAGGGLFTARWLRARR